MPWSNSAALCVESSTGDLRVSTETFDALFGLPCHSTGSVTALHARVYVNRNFHHQPLKQN